VSSTRSSKGKKSTETDFETYVQESLDSIRNDITDIKTSQTKIIDEIATQKHKIKFNDKASSSLQKANLSLQDKYKKINGEIFDTKLKMDALQNKFKLGKESLNKMAPEVNKSYEKCLVLERYSRD